MLKDVNNFIQKIESMAEKINLSFFKDFFESSSSADYAKTFINTKNPDENKENIADIKGRISNLKDRIKKMSETEYKNKNADEILKIIKYILDYNKNAQKKFRLHQKLIKANQCLKKNN